MYDTTITTKNKAKLKFRLRSAQKHEAFLNGRSPNNQDFNCTHCKYPVSAERLIAAVGNRNHCPYCLWSRHMDLHEAGDRLSACKEPMKAVALALKHRHKKYNSGYGELMLVHLCLDCGKVTANRIAADDAPDRLLQIFEHSMNMDSYLRLMIESAGIHPLDKSDRPIVHSQLYGINLLQTT
jgi:hypothetical protein